MIFPDRPDGRPMKLSCRPVVRMLREAGERGVTTGEFTEARIARAAARMEELRHIYGFEINSRRVTASSFRFTLISEPDARAGRDESPTETPASHPSPADPAGVLTFGPSTGPRSAIFEPDYLDAA